MLGLNGRIIQKHIRDCSGHTLAYDLASRLAKLLLRLNNQSEERHLLTIVNIERGLKTLASKQILKGRLYSRLDHVRLFL